MLFEFRVEVTIAMLSSFFGIILLLMYARGGAKGRHSAIWSFISLLISGTYTCIIHAYIYALLRKLAVI